MNAIALQKIIADAVKDNLLLNWHFYVLLIGVGILTSIAVSFFEGWGKRKGEVAASKADFDEIKRQLKETTETVKSVEFSLAHSDWMRREHNTLRRVKLEQLLTAAFALATWASEHVSVMSEKDISKENMPPIDEFEMLALLYFSDLIDEIAPLTLAFRKFRMHLTNFCYEFRKLDLRWEAALSAKNNAAMQQILDEKQKFLSADGDSSSEKAGEVYRCALDLAAAARRLMAELTSQPSQAPRSL
jgi:hypothetical protein